MSFECRLNMSCSDILYHDCYTETSLKLLDYVLTNGLILVQFAFVLSLSLAFEKMKSNDVLAIAKI